MYTPEQFGEGVVTACPVLKQAVEKFATFTLASDIAPMWSKQQIESTLAPSKEPSIGYGILFTEANASFFLY